MPRPRTSVEGVRGRPPGRRTHREHGATIATRDRRRTGHGSPAIRAAFAAAGAAYLVSCGIGTAAAARILPPRPELRLHHRAYVLTCALTAVALAAPLWAGPAARPAARRCAVALAPALLTLAALPRAGTRTRRHPALALTAAPWFAASTLTAWS